MENDDILWTNKRNCFDKEEKNIQMETSRWKKKINKKKNIFNNANAIKKWTQF